MPLPQPSPHPEPIEPIIWLLAFLVVLFAFMVIGVSKWSPSDGQTFQVTSGVLTTVLGAFVGRIMPGTNIKKAPPTTNITTTNNGSAGPATIISETGAPHDGQQS